MIWSDKGAKASLLYTGEEKESLNLLTLCRAAFPHPLPVYRQCPCNKLCLHRTKICICTTYLLITIASSAHWSPSLGINSNMSSLWYLFFKTGLPRMYFHSPVLEVTHQTDKFNFRAHASECTYSILEFLWQLSAVQIGLFLQYIFCKVRW